MLKGGHLAGETVTGETWVPEPPKGARFDRHVRFVGGDGKVKVEAVTTWALIDRATGRLLRFASCQAGEELELLVVPEPREIGLVLGQDLEDLVL